MSRYAVNTLLYRLKKDADFRARFTANRAGALADADLTDAEREALVQWDPRRINALGGYLHLLMSIPAWKTTEARGARAIEAIHGRALATAQPRKPARPGRG